MKKIKKIAVLFGLTLMLGSMPVFAENVEQVSVSENENAVSPRSNKVTYGARTIANGGYGYFMIVNKSGSSLKVNSASVGW